jgi:hypothetical protein
LRPLRPHGTDRSDFTLRTLNALRPLWTDITHSARQTDWAGIACRSLRTRGASGTRRTSWANQRDCCGPYPSGLRAEKLAGGRVEIKVSVHALSSFRSYGAVEDGLAIGTAGSRGTGITLRPLRSLGTHGTNCTLLSLGPLRTHSTCRSGFALRSLRAYCAFLSLRPGSASGTCRTGWANQRDCRGPSPCGFRSEELTGSRIQIEVSVHALAGLRSNRAVEDGPAIGAAGAHSAGITLRPLRSLRAHSTNCTF